MRASRALARSLVSEILIYAGLGCFAFVGILVVLNLAKEIEDLVAVGLAPGDLWAITRSLLPIVLGYAAPVGFLFGALVAIGRMSADLEVLAMRTCGLGMAQLYWPVAALGLAISLLTALLIIHVEPKARLAMRHVLKDVASRGAILEAGRFRNIAGRVVYVDRRDGEGNLGSIMIADSTGGRAPSIIFADRGRFRFDNESATIHLELESGDILLETPGAESSEPQRIAFEALDYAFDASPLLDVEASLRPRDLGMTTLLERRQLAHTDALPEKVRRRNPFEYDVQIHRRLALPLAPLLFGGIAVPIAARRSRTNRSWGALLCTTLVGIYYLLLNAGERLADKGLAPAAIAVWVPNLLFLGGALWLWWRAKKNPWDDGGP